MEQYTAARGAVDGWLEGLQTDLKRGWIIDRGGHDARMHDAANRIAEFDATATTLLTYGVSGVDVGAIFAGMATLGKVLADILNEGYQRDAQQREKIVQQLNDLRWKEFDGL